LIWCGIAVAGNAAFEPTGGVAREDRGDAESLLTAVEVFLVSHEFVTGPIL